jgi:hypothetical protein
MEYDIIDVADPLIRGLGPEHPGVSPPQTNFWIL